MFYILEYWTEFCITLSEHTEGPKSLDNKDTTVDATDIWNNSMKIYASGRVWLMTSYELMNDGPAQWIYSIYYEAFISEIKHYAGKKRVLMFYNETDTLEQTGKYFALRWNCAIGRGVEGSQNLNYWQTWHSLVMQLYHSHITW